MNDIYKSIIDVAVDCAAATPDLEFAADRIPALWWCQGLYIKKKRREEKCRII